MLKQGEPFYSVGELDDYLWREGTRGKCAFLVGMQFKVVRQAAMMGKIKRAESC